MQISKNLAMLVPLLLALTASATGLSPRQNATEGQNAVIDNYPVSSPQPNNYCPTVTKTATETATKTTTETKTSTTTCYETETETKTATKTETEVETTTTTCYETIT